MLQLIGLLLVLQSLFMSPTVVVFWNGPFALLEREAEVTLVVRGASHLRRVNGNDGPETLLRIELL